jgi:hypothetical protein
VNLVYMKTGDLEPALVLQLTSDDYPLDLEGAVGVAFRMRAVRDPLDVLMGTADVVDMSDGVVRYVWQEGDTNRTGTYVGEFVVEWSANRRQTFPASGFVLVEFVAGL